MPGSTQLEKLNNMSQKAVDFEILPAFVFEAAGWMSRAFSGSCGHFHQTASPLHLQEREESGRERSRPVVSMQKNLAPNAPGPCKAFACISEPCVLPLRVHLRRDAFDVL